MGTEIRLLIAWSAHKLAPRDALILPDIYADVGPYLYGLSRSRNEVFSYQSRGVIDSNIVIMTKQDSSTVARMIEKSLSNLTSVKRTKRKASSLRLRSAHSKDHNIDLGLTWPV